MNLAHTLFSSFDIEAKVRTVYAGEPRSAVTSHCLSIEILRANGIIENGRKRANENSDDIIDIGSSDSERPSTPLHPASQSANVIDTPSKKRVKREPESDKMPLTRDENSNTLEEISIDSLNDEPETMTDSVPQQLTNSTPPAPSTPMDNTKQHMEDEDDGQNDDEVLDMLADDDEGILSIGPPQDLRDLPPPSSSPGPQPLASDDDNLSDSG
ncbi:hypothetical protein EW145_g5212 [Phellinidium pouzarii]|uniref:Uncharacterized protein n=1 Tax=Phellinidium pouzarii TaxID=167371 RepID=A0A4S4L262_9AGAM|nr:hypothetical protein EW145_g5212 [Phellinidium pouzarii]